MKTTSVRLDDADHARIAETTDYTTRSLNAEMSAAAVVYADLISLARARTAVVTGDIPASELSELVERLKEDIGRIMLTAFPNDACSVFENARGVEYPKHGFGPLDVPFSELIDWIVTGATK